MRTTLQVGKDKKIKSIQAAIDLAQNDTVIDIDPGLYMENLIIMKPGLKIKQKDKGKANPNEVVILLADTGPAIFIDIPKDERC